MGKIDLILIMLLEILIALNIIFAIIIGRAPLISFVSISFSAMVMSAATLMLMNEDGNRRI